MINKHCVKSVQIRSFFWSVFSCIRTEYRKIQTRKNSEFGHFSRHNILSTRTNFFLSSSGKIESVQEFKIKLFSSSCFIADNSHVKIVWLHVAVFSKHDILHFWDNFHLFKFYPVKVPQNCSNSFNYSNQTCIQVSKFSFALGK